MSEVMNSKCEQLIEYTGNANFKVTNSSVPSKMLDTRIKITERRINCAEVDIGRYSIFQIANWFLQKSPMTQKKLQKLCYYAQAWFYALKGIRLADSDFQAWVHGPISPILYERFKPFGFDTIKLKHGCVVSIDEEDKTLLEDVWETYGNYSGNALEALAHYEEPWIQARIGYASNERCCIVISPDSMKSYYQSIYKK